MAIAAAIHADRCDIYTDVDGVYTTDPRVVSDARRLRPVPFEEMLEMASLGAKVLASTHLGFRFEAGSRTRRSAGITTTLIQGLPADG